MLLGCSASACSSSHKHFKFMAAMVPMRAPIASCFKFRVQTQSKKLCTVRRSVRCNGDAVRARLYLVAPLHRTHGRKCICANTQCPAASKATRNEPTCSCKAVDDTWQPDGSIPSNVCVCACICMYVWFGSQANRLDSNGRIAPNQTPAPRRNATQTRCLSSGSSLCSDKI